MMHDVWMDGRDVNVELILMMVMMMMDGGVHVYGTCAEDRQATEKNKI